MKKTQTSKPFAYIPFQNDFLEGQALAINNFSSGMRQLAATTLLWALKEVSGKNIPLIIDTPLARIDRKHQDNLLSQYYPTVLIQTESSEPSAQVIVFYLLPT